MKTNAVDLRSNMKDIMRAIDRSEQVTVLYHGKEKAVIMPIEQVSDVDIKSHPFFGMLQDSDTVESIVDDLRTGRY
ncbi:MAG: type II toxin-antitoxin system Phd/YefM family antitoxin [Gammaproteobacteria bacterium]|nr:type II toxin-antitoxin system Phd/YefM family antitoxin [Gammaproteobacteria bacterium]